MILIQMKADRVVTKMNKDHLLFEYLSAFVRSVENKGVSSDKEIEKELQNYLDTAFRIKDDTANKVINYFSRYINE